jgi:hypothetical protein
MPIEFFLHWHDDIVLINTRAALLFRHHGSWTSTCRQQTAPIRARILVLSKYVRNTFSSGWKPKGDLLVKAVMFLVCANLTEVK